MGIREISDVPGHGGNPSYLHEENPHGFSGQVSRYGIPFQNPGRNPASCGNFRTSMKNQPGGPSLQMP